MNDFDWPEYYRRLALRDERRRQVREAVGFSNKPGRGVPLIDRLTGRTPLDERDRTREQYLRDEEEGDS